VQSALDDQSEQLVVVLAHDAVHAARVGLDQNGPAKTT
jgi:hypothetical protein